MRNQTAEAKRAKVELHVEDKEAEKEKRLFQTHKKPEYY